MSYATPSILLQQFDARTIGDVIADSGSRVTPTQILTDANVLYALSRASGVINSACQIARRYTPVQLAALTGDDAAILQGLTCDMAFVYLCQRRGLTPPGYTETHERSNNMLAKLSKGEMLFNVPADVAAGLPGDEFPDQATYSTVNLLRDYASRLFPLRRRQQPSSGGFTGPYGSNS